AEYEMIAEETSIEVSQIQNNKQELVQNEVQMKENKLTELVEVERGKSNSVDENALSGSAKMAFSNATYCVTKEQLQGVLLKRTENNTIHTKPVTTLISTKNDLIEELKMAKNLEGIKKVKESHRNANEVR